MTRKTEADRVDIYTRITDRIVEDLGQGVRPWMKPWSAANTSDRITRPVRHNGLPYSGMNVLLLWSEQMSRGFCSSMWMTFKQALELGGAVRKGETGSTVVFASRFTKPVADGSGNVWFDPVWPTGFAVVTLAGVGIVATLSHVFLTFALRMAPAGLVSSLQYFEIVGATIVGYIAFGDLPTPLTVLGIAIIVASGLYTITRERRLERAAARPLPPA